MRPNPPDCLTTRSPEDFLRHRTAVKVALEGAKSATEIEGLVLSIADDKTEVRFSKARLPNEVESLYKFHFLGTPISTYVREKKDGSFTLFVDL